MLRVTVVFAVAPRQVRECVLDVPEGSTVRQALERSAVLQGCDATLLDQCETGVWGHKCGLQRVLRADDRVEVYRPLRVDPKEARRQRFVRQGSKRAGLFAQRRTGAKPGY
ncbi:MAG: RnfH family protein [Rhodoferax sp.]